MSDWRIVEYKIVTGKGTINTAEAVTKELSKGWQPYGDLIFYRNQEGFEFWLQPMVRYGGAEPDKLAQHFDQLIDAADHLILTFATSEHPDDHEDCLSALGRALYYLKKRGGRVKIPATSIKAQRGKGQE